MIAFIDEHRAVDGGEPICRVLPIAPSTYYAHAIRRADPSKAPVHFQVYGGRKVWRQLRREGIEWRTAR